jgi:hypothetical protein
VAADVGTLRRGQCPADEGTGNQPVGPGGCVDGLRRDHRERGPFPQLVVQGNKLRLHINLALAAHLATYPLAAGAAPSEITPRQLPAQASCSLASEHAVPAR